MTASACRFERRGGGLTTTVAATPPAGEALWGGGVFMALRYCVALTVEL